MEDRQEGMTLEIEQKIRRSILQQVDLSRDISDQEIIAMIQREICQMDECKSMVIEQRLVLQNRIFNSLRKLDVLQDLLEDDAITEIMINGYDHIFVEREGHIYETHQQFSSKEKLDDIVQQIVASNNRIVNEAVPIVDTRLADGSRVNIVLPPASVDGSIISIRKFPKEAMTMQRLIELHSLSEEVSEFLQQLVIAGYNVFISGGTGSGKTTFLNALTEYIPDDQRVITIEDSAELQLQGVKNLVRLEARNSNLEGMLEITIRDLVRTSLRMRPDRIIVGECRGAEALEVLQAANTGHDGGISTGHGNSPQDMLSRLETMVLMAGMELPVNAIRKQIASGIDILIHLGRLRDKSRKVLNISEVVGMHDGEVELQTLYEFVPQEEYKSRVRGIWKQRNPLEHTGKLVRAGIKIS